MLGHEGREQEGTLTALALDVERRTAADQFDPRDGSWLVLHLEQAGGWLPGSFNYFNLLGEARYYYTVADRLTLAERVRYGSISPLWRTATVPFFRRYFLGGTTSLRGWGRLEVSPLSGTGVPVGGHTLFEGSSEVRVPLFAKLTGVVFVDAGNVWSSDWELDLGDLLADAGTGLRYQTPFGLARFDFAYQLNRLDGLQIDGKPESRRWRIHFSIGQAF